MAIEGQCELTAQCLCEAHAVRAPIPISSLPLQASCCHCTSCRHMTGAMYSTNTAWPGTLASVRALGLREYQFSPAVTIFFCGSCGSPMFCYERRSANGAGQAGEEETLEVFTGVLSVGGRADAVRVRDHIFVGDTLDGGAAIWMRHLPGQTTPLPCYRSWRQTSGLVDPVAMAEPSRDGIRNQTRENVPFHCHCRAIDLVLCRKATDNLARRQPAGHSARSGHSSPYKLTAWFDASRSSQTCAGVDVMSWVSVKLRSIGFASFPGTRFPSNIEDLRLATSDPRRPSQLRNLAHYKTRDGGYQHFCSNCAASVFYADGPFPGTVNVAVGLLHAVDGVRAAGVVDWAPGASRWGDFVHAGWRGELVGATRRNVEEWRRQEDGRSAIPRAD